MNQKFTLIFIFFILALQLAYAGESNEENLYEGFVITSMGDTIRGQVQFVNPVYNELKVRLYDEKGKHDTYKTGDIVEYAFLFPDKKSQELKWVNYVRKRVDVSPIQSSTQINTVFLQRVTQGKVTLYNYYTLETAKINSREYVKNYYVEQQTPNGFDLTHVNSDNFREYARTLLASNQTLYEQLGKSGFGFNYFSKVIEEHNKFLNGEPMNL
jgi:hypothetical protein